MTWRDDLRPASFRGLFFKVESTSRAGGRRGVTYEFPRRDSSLDEDLGRRARRFALTGYVIGNDHHAQADALEAALSGNAQGSLTLPLMGSVQARCESYARTERRQEGGLTSFEMAFVEVQSTSVLALADTMSAVSAAADKAGAAVAASADRMAADKTNEYRAPPPPPASAPNQTDV